MKSLISVYVGMELTLGSGRGCDLVRGADALSAVM
jgi:hypothetical protein